MCLAAAAAWSAVAAFESLQPPELYALPQEIYADYVAADQQAQYRLEARGNYVAVCSGKGDKTLLVTDIELNGLRGADRAMIEMGIPVTDRQQLLLLLEDLGS